LTPRGRFGPRRAVASIEMPARLLLVVVAALWTGAALAITPPARAASARWSPPVAGAPTRLFDFGRDPFARGQHRGVDLDAAPGERVRSACGGPVVFAGRVAGAGTVSVRCGKWRVSYAPLARLAVRAGARVGPGRLLGRMTGAAPLHLGVRRESARFGYVDPLRFLAAADRAPPPGVPVRRPAPTPRARSAPRPARPSPTLAPWSVWVGLALLMTGLVGAGTLRFPLRKTGGAACPASSTSSSSPTTPSRP
jgi:Peptidase family M23